MICDTCRLSIGHIQTVDDYEDICAVADDPIARLDGSIGTEGCAWYLSEGLRSLKDRIELEGVDMNSPYPKVVN